MKKIILLLLLFILLLSTKLVFSHVETQDFEKLNIEKVMNDIDTIKQEIDSTFYYINGTYEILKEEVKLFGWKRTIQMNSGIFLPFVIFCWVCICSGFEVEKCHNHEYDSQLLGVRFKSSYSER